jgi:hypothetical protein
MLGTEGDFNADNAAQAMAEAYGMDKDTLMQQAEMQGIGDLKNSNPEDMRKRMQEANAKMGERMRQEQ